MCYYWEQSVTSTAVSPVGARAYNRAVSHTIAELQKADTCLMFWCIFGKPVLWSQCGHTSFIHVTRDSGNSTGPTGLVFIMTSLEKETGTSLRSHLRNDIPIGLVPEVHRVVLVPGSDQEAHCNLRHLNHMRPLWLSQVHSCATQAPYPFTCYI